MADGHSSAPTGGMQVAYELRPSTIAGRGIFTLAAVPRGTLLWKYSVGESVLEHDEASLRARLQTMPKEEVVDLLEHIYIWNDAAIEIIDDAKVWNHAPKPNTGEHPDESKGMGDGLSSYALRDIEAGEELTDDYGLHPSLPWFEAICAEYGAASCSAMGREQR